MLYLGNAGNKHVYCVQVAIRLGIVSIQSLATMQRACTHFSYIH